MPQLRSRILTSPSATTITLLSLVIVVSAVLPVLMTGALVVQMRGDLGLDPGLVGLATAAFYSGGAMGSLALGRFIQRIGSLSGLRLSAMLSALSLAGIALLSSSAVTLSACLLVGGLANASAHPAANQALLRAVPANRQGILFGVKQAAIPMASLLGGVAVPAVALTVGWRWAFLVAAVMASGIAIAVPRSHQDSASAATSQTRAQLGRPSSALLVLALAGCLAAMPANSIGAFLVLSNVESGMSEGMAGLVLSSAAALGIVVRIGVGWLADRSGKGRLTGVAALLGGGAIGFLTLAVPLPAPALAGSLLAYALGWGWPGLFNFAVARSHAENAAAATGVALTGIYVGGALGPLVFGAVVNRSSFATAWTLSAGTALASALLMLLARRLLRRERE